MKKIKGVLSVVVVLLMVLAMFPTTAFAATNTSVTSLPTSAGSTLSNGYIYTVRSNITINGGTGQSALVVASGATVAIDIASGYTLTVNGGAGSGRTGGGAGIYLPSNSTLIITGGGRLSATGGMSGYPSSGTSSGTVGRYGSDSGNYSGVRFYTGQGGTGGYGGGGAGAGIGTSGGYGGYGGSFGDGKDIVFSTDSSGYAGANGSSGSASASSGALYVLGSASVYANAGALRDNTGSSGSVSSSSKVYYHSGWSRYQSIGSGGGGGGGGKGSAANSIGSGGGGGGGGGGGAGGTAYWYYYNTKSTRIYYGGGGGGGASYYASGGTGYTSSNVYYYDGSSGASYRNYGYGLYIEQGSAGGSGGSAGAWGNNGSVYKSSTAYLSGASYSTVSTHSAVSSTISFNRQNGSGGTSSMTVTYGSPMGNISIPSRSQYSFMGYYTGTNGTGTRYFDHRGVPSRNYYDTSNTTLYAYWVQSQFNITLNPQGGTVEQKSLLTTGSDGTLPASLSANQIPSRVHYGFDGYFSASAGQGTKYYNSNGTVTSSSNKIKTNTSIYAGWTQNQYLLGFQFMGGSGGTSSAWTTGTDGTLPVITVPSRPGYEFDGYYTSSNGAGTKYYNADGSATNVKMTQPNGISLYANWKFGTYGINYAGLEGAVISGNPSTRVHNVACSIPNPTKEGYTFMGWQIEGGADRYKDLVIGANNLSYAKDITLTATWMVITAKLTDTQLNVQGAVSNPDEIAAALQQVFNYIVTDPTKGVTAADMAGTSSVKLTLAVNAVNAVSEELILAIAQGTAIQSYDIKVYKDVTTEGNGVIRTELTELPVPITIKIPLSGSVAPTYAVYRVHGETPERLPEEAGENGEYYEVLDDTILVQTRKFSTYSVVGTAVGLDNDNGAVSDFAGGQALDVQGRVVEVETAKVFKIDLSWGEMKFEYSLQQEWDPYAHMYTEGALNDWRVQGFENGNNRVQALNHSNGDIRVNFTVAGDLDGVAMSMHIYNEKTSEEAKYFLLQDAPEGSLTEELIPCEAYLYLSGPPTSQWINANKQNFTKVGVITVTVEPYPDA